MDWLDSQYEVPHRWLLEREKEKRLKRLEASIVSAEVLARSEEMVKMTWMASQQNKTQHLLDPLGTAHENLAPQGIALSRQLLVRRDAELWHGPEWV